MDFSVYTVHGAVPDTPVLQRKKREPIILDEQMDKWYNYQIKLQSQPCQYIIIADEDDRDGLRF